MSPESNSENMNAGKATAEIAFVQQALAAADRSERFTRIIVVVLGILAVVVFIWMHHHMFPQESLGGLLHTLLRVDLFFLVVIFALTMYVRQVINRSTRIILRALANTRNR
jgi:DMSO/TMAO reductase YedYZ heme-binding membrane subunit